MTTNENNFKNKCKNMRELFFGKKTVKTFLSANKELIYINEDSENGTKYSSRRVENNFVERCEFKISIPLKSKDLSECDNFREHFFIKTDPNNETFRDADGVKYITLLKRDLYVNSCYFHMTNFKKIQSKYY